MKGKNVRRTGTTRTSQAQEVRKPCYHDPRPKQQQKEVGVGGLYGDSKQLRVNEGSGQGREDPAPPGILVGREHVFMSS
ncbi:hypothetical protein NC652_013967 [Populus alba x Populus x berolinensis]|nr:hypothetical protein NC652_013967 [Populus alba x Populus x berolinensis]